MTQYAFSLKLDITFPPWEAYIGGALMRIAVIEDDQRYIDAVKDYIQRYETATGFACEVIPFSSADAFLFNYRPIYDCAIMDIDLPGMGGMEAAKKLREMDENVMIVFSTSYAQFAINGYEVNAIDYLVKPYPYEAFALTLDRARRRAAVQLMDSITVRNREREVHIPVRSIFYVEQKNHRLLYHTDTGVIDVWGTMPMAEKTLAPFSGFEKCGASYLVNLRYVRAVVDGMVTVGNEKLSLSRGRKKEFLQALNTFFATGGGA